MPAHRQPAKAHKRLGYWYFVRRVPKEYRDVDRRNPVMISTGIPISDDPLAIRANRKIARLDAALEHEWRVLKTPRDTAAEVRFEEHQAIADKLGIDYVPAAELVDLPVDQLVSRLLMIAQDGNASDRAARSAVLGIAPRPTLMISQLLTEYNRSAKVSEGPERGMVRAFEIFQSVIGGDRPLCNLTRRDVIAYRAYWERQVEQKKTTVTRANSHIRHMKKIFKEIGECRAMEFGELFRPIALA